MKKKQYILIIGAGIAGLTAGYSIVLNSDEYKPIIIEKDSDIGGLARTYNYDGIKADIGPHRFFTKNEEVFNLWKEILPLQGYNAKDDIYLERMNDFKNGIANPQIDDKVFLKRRRFSRIYYNKKFFDYPIKINLSTIFNMGCFNTLLCGFSYIKSCFIKQKEKNLEDFMINRFGKKLYSMFFEHYTEKVWGRHPKNISKEWGEQRIKGLSLLKAIFSKFKAQKENSLVEEYFYPKYGANQMCEEMAKVILDKGGEIYLNSKVTNIKLEDNEVKKLEIISKNNKYELSGDFIISSMPIKDLIGSMDNCPQLVKNIAENLPYRDYQLVSFLVKNFNLVNNTDWKTINNICPDSWIYIQDRDVTIGRIYIPKNFSPYLSNDLNDTLICLEYFCNKNDKLWLMSDEEIYSYAINELIKINAITSDKDIIKSYQLKKEKAYPAYFDSYKEFSIVKNFLSSIDNLICIGRNGQHKYNNMDHSTLSGITAADIIINKLDKSVIWDINTDKTYQEVKS